MWAHCHICRLFCYCSQPTYSQRFSQFAIKNDWETKFLSHFIISFTLLWHVTSHIKGRKQITEFEILTVVIHINPTSPPVMSDRTSLFKKKTQNVFVSPWNNWLEGNLFAFVWGYGCGLCVWWEKSWTPEVYSKLVWLVRNLLYSIFYVLCTVCVALLWLQCFIFYLNVKNHQYIWILQSTVHVLSLFVMKRKSAKETRGLWNFFFSINKFPTW